MTVFEQLLEEARDRWGAERADALRPLLERTAQDLERVRRESLDLMDDPPLPWPSRTS